MFKDKENGKTTVVVGTWNKEEHSEWAQKNVARAYHLKDDGAQTVKYVNFICAFQHNMESVVSVGRSVGQSVYKNGERGRKCMRGNRQALGLSWTVSQLVLFSVNGVLSRIFP